MNARTIKSQIKKAGFNLDEWQVEKAYKCYNIFLTTYGLSDTERQTMTGDEVNDRRAADNGKIREMAQLFEVIPARSGGVTVLTDLAPNTWE